MSALLFVPKPGDRVRVVAIGPGDGYAEDPTAIGTIGTVEVAEEALADPNWLWLELGPDATGPSRFLECRVELVNEVSLA